MFSRIIEFFEDPRIAIPTATILGMGIVGGGTWFATRNWMIAIAVALAIALVVLVVILLRTLRSSEREERLAGGLEDPNAAGAADAASTTGAQSGGIRGVFLQALAEIRSSRMGAEGVQSLPWWITLGPTGSGKTELIRNAGLDVPAEFAHSLRSGPTSGVHFVLSNQAVVMDAAGEFIDAGDEAPADWEPLLKLLKKHRSANPLEGVLVALSASDLMSQDPEARADQARALRRRLNEIAEGLRFDVPIYVVVTHLDQVRGFLEFTSGLPAQRSREAFGWTNDRRSLPDMAATVQTALERVMDRVDAFVPELLLREADPTRRRDIFGLPQELGAINAALVEFVRIAFAPSVYQEVPFLRGIYYTSAERGGATISSVAHRVGQAWASQLAQPPVGAGGIFTSGLFRDIVVGDCDLAIATGGIGRRTRNVVIGLTAALSLVTLGLAGAGFVDNFTAIRDLDAKTARLLDAPSSLDASDVLRESIVAARSPEAALAVPFMTWTRERAWDRATQVFNWTIAREHILPAKKRLGSVVRRSEADAFEGLAVLALDVSWMAKRAEVDPNYRPNLVQYTPFASRDRSRDAAVFTAGYEAYVRWEEEAELGRQIKEERDLVLDSATSLLDLRRLEDWSQRRAEQQPPVRYADFGVRETGADDLATVMGAYTRAGWEGLVRDLLRAVEDSGGAEDANIRRFRNGYVDRFDRSWRAFLLGTPLSVEASINVLESPHLKLFEQIAFEVGADLPRAGARPDWMTKALDTRDDAAPPAAEDLPEGTPPPPPPPWTRYRRALDQVGLDASSISGQSSGKQALQIARKMGESSSFSDGLGLLEELFPPRGESPEERKMRLLLAMPIFDAGQSVLEAAIPELSERWYDEIYRPYAIEGADPIALYDPKEGSLARFMDAELEPFFERDEPKRVIGGLTLPMSDRFLGWLDHAFGLQRALFPGAGRALQVPVRLEGVPSQVMNSPGTFPTRQILRLDCLNKVQSFEYFQGIGEQTFVWTPDCQQVTLRIWVRPPGESAAVELTPRREWNGPLAFPKFLREARRVGGNLLQWNYDYDGKIVRVEYRMRSGNKILALEHRNPPKALRKTPDAN